MDMINSITNNDHSLRELIKNQREQRTPRDTSRGALIMRGRLFTWLAALQKSLKEQNKPLVKTIAAFWSLPEEPELQPLLEQWVEEHNYEVILPVVKGKNMPLEFRAWTPEQGMTRGAYGVMEPTGPVVNNPDLMLVPTLGYSREGYRLGYGGGYYDRTIGQLRQSGHQFTTIGIGWACGDLSLEIYSSHTPWQWHEHDQKLDLILTDKGWAKSG